MTKDNANLLKLLTAIIAMIHAFAFAYMSRNKEVYEVISIVFLCTALICVATWHPKDETAALREQLEDQAKIIKELKQKTNI